MSRRWLPAAVAALALACAPVAASAATRATLRIVTPSRTVLGAHAPLVGATRSYLDDAGTPHALKPNTVMGQLVAGTAFFGLPLDVAFNAQLGGGFVSSIDGIAGGSKGFWELFVNDRAATVGAEAATFKAGDEVVWLLDPDFAAPGPFYLDLNVVRRRRGRVTFAVVKAGGTQPVAAVGATIRVNGRILRTAANGRVSVQLRRGRPFQARATMHGAVRSQVVGGRA
jgi:hypothetical protein